MRIALVAPTYLGPRGALERRVDQLAHGLAARGAEVEILTQGPLRWEQHAVVRPGVTLRRFPSVVGRLRFTVAPGIYEGLRAAADEFDLVDVHTGHAALALAAARAKFPHRVLSPYGVVHRLTSGPYAYVARLTISSYTQVICSSASERELLLRRFPGAADRTCVMSPAVDSDALEATRSFTASRDVVVAVGPLERPSQINRAIAAMLAVEPPLRLLIAGDGWARGRLQAYAADLRLASRVEFTGPLTNCDLYRWLRTARVVLALADEHTSGLEMAEALTVGTPVVASDIPTHREVAAQFASPRVHFVPPAGSLLHVADAIAEAIESPGCHSANGRPGRSWESAIDEMWDLYRGLIHGTDGKSVTDHVPSPLPTPTSHTSKQAALGR